MPADCAWADAFVSATMFDDTALDSIFSVKTGLSSERAITGAHTSDAAAIAAKENFPNLILISHLLGTGQSHTMQGAMFTVYGFIESRNALLVLDIKMPPACMQARGTFLIHYGESVPEAKASGRRRLVRPTRAPG